TSHIGLVGRRRDRGRKTSKASAAKPDRKLATCHPLSDVALMAAPPVEKRTAAANTISLARTSYSYPRCFKSACGLHGRACRIAAVLRCVPQWRGPAVH